MPSLSSPLAPNKGRLMTTKHAAAAAVLLILLSVVLFPSSCEARSLRVHGKRRRSSSNSSHLPAAKDVATTSLKDEDWGTTEARSTVQTAATDDDMMAQPDVKAKVGVPTASSTAAGGTVVGVTPVVRALSQREDNGFHLDYAGPRTHTPSHN